MTYLIVNSHQPRGYKDASQYPRLRGQGFCRCCLCSPCVIVLPPDFLRGSCSPHPANDEKRYVLYRKIWGLLNDVGLWKDDDYLSRKEEKTARDDKRDVMPDCVIKVINNILTMFVCNDDTSDKRTINVSHVLSKLYNYVFWAIY